MDTGTYANRNMMMFGTNAGAWDTGIVYPPPSTPSLIQLLMNAGYTWGSYTFDLPFSGSLDMTMKDPGIHTMQDLYDALDQGTLPNVAFVDARDSIDDDHPPADLQKGEAWTKTIYDHAVKSPQWGRTAIIWTYDEAGGLFDHVPPSEKTCAPSKREPFVDRGTRVPFVMISPWAKRNYVSHTVQDHMAITRFIETLFGLPALTPRDANATVLFDLLDFSCPENLTVPPAPEAGTGGCANPP
jgi:phospholipase C